MTDNTPLNADDELDRYLFDTWNMKDTVHNRVLADSIKRWRKKHELEARIDELENRLRVQFIPSHWERLRSETNSWAKYVDRRIAELKQELENL